MYFLNLFQHLCLAKLGSYVSYILFMPSETTDELSTRQRILVEWNVASDSYHTLVHHNFNCAADSSVAHPHDFV